MLSLCVCVCVSVVAPVSQIYFLDFTFHFVCVCVCAFFPLQMCFHILTGIKYSSVTTVQQQHRPSRYFTQTIMQLNCLMVYCFLVAFFGCTFFVKHLLCVLEAVLALANFFFCYVVNI